MPLRNTIKNNNTVWHVEWSQQLQQRSIPLKAHFTQSSDTFLLILDCFVLLLRSTSSGCLHLGIFARIKSNFAPLLCRCGLMNSINFSIFLNLSPAIIANALDAISNCCHYHGSLEIRGNCRTDGEGREERG